ncbi:MAG: hypothetical protein L0Y66_19660, partial [Myxococcaceae bacterium]|nr:hypothetical protein [Myxococcaceae bacterium]
QQGPNLAYAPGPASPRMSHDVQERTERALETARFRHFTRWLTWLCALFTLIYGVAGLALEEARLLGAAVGQEPSCSSESSSSMCAGGTRTSPLNGWCSARMV